MQGELPGFAAVLSDVVGDERAGGAAADDQMWLVRHPAQASHCVGMGCRQNGDALLGPQGKEKTENGEVEKREKEGEIDN